MKAVVLREPRNLVLMDVPRPELSDEHHVLVQVRACGICGSDLRYWVGENPWALHTLGYHEPSPPNMILGHELSGVVMEVNHSRYEHLLGRRVGVQAWRSCGTCRLCHSGHRNLCRATAHLGHGQGWGEREYYPGGYAEYSLAWGDLVYPMEDHVTFAEEAMRDIVGVAVHAVRRGQVGGSGAVLCIGGGPVGLCVAQVAATEVSGPVFVSEPSPLARGILGRYPRLTVVDPARRDIADALHESVGQMGCSVVFDTVGTVETVEQGLALLDEAGTYVNLAVHDVQVPVNMRTLGSERTLTTSSNAHYADERRAHALIGSPDIDVASMITHRLPLEAYEQAFDLLLSEPRRAYKVVFEMD